MLLYEHELKDNILENIKGQTIIQWTYCYIMN